MGTNENVAVVLETFRAVEQRDRQRLNELYHPEVEFRWPPSPLRIAVEIDPGADEGPLAIEFATERDVDIPAGRHPVLGAVFTRVPLRRD